MPAELCKLFWDGKARADERVKIIEENLYWFSGEKDFHESGPSIYEPYTCEGLGSISPSVMMSVSERTHTIR